MWQSTSSPFPAVLMAFISVLFIGLKLLDGDLQSPAGLTNAFLCLLQKRTGNNGNDKSDLQAQIQA